jgi:LacI family transcriptional regulator
MTAKIKNKKLTLRDIAQKAGVSVSTVSQILNNRESNFCSEEKKKHVKAVAAEMNYQVNFGYRLMHGIKTNTVGIIRSTPKSSDEEYLQELHLKLMEKLEKHKYSVYIATMSESGNDNLGKIRNLSDRGCSAFIFIGCPVGYEQLEKYIIDTNCSYVAFCASPFKRNIGLDSGLAMREYIAYLQTLSKTDFAIIGGTPSTSKGSALEGLFNSFPEQKQVDLIERYYYQIKQEYLFDNDFAKSLYEIGKKITSEILQKKPNIGAFIYENDYLAIGGAKAITDIGLLPGKDVLLRGYNNTNVSRFFPYPISSVSHNVEKICDTIFEKLFCKTPFNLLIEQELVIRT